MDDFFEARWHIPDGGRPVDNRGVGSIHLSVRSGSRASGSSAGAAFAYVTRTGEFGDRDLDEAVYTESDHMPAWATDDPREFWDAADMYERANGRLFVSADFALPRGLDRDEQITMAREFVHALTDDERLPYTFAIHAGRDAAGREHNPHAHVLISERSNDGVARPREQWFRRANRAHPEQGGAPKKSRRARTRLDGTGAIPVGLTNESRPRGARSCGTGRPSQLCAAGCGSRTWHPLRTSGGAPAAEGPKPRSPGAIGGG